MKELWKDIPRYEGLYQASSLGNIRSLDRIITKKNRWGGYTRELRKGRCLKPVKTNGDYIRVTLVDRNNSRKLIRVHCLIALTFIGNRPVNNVVRHLDGNPKNNNIYNLAYGTKRDNVIDMYRYGSKNGVLTIPQVLEIRELLRSKIETHIIAETFSVSVSQIQAIKNNKCFQWLREDGSING